MIAVIITLWLVFTVIAVCIVRSRNNPFSIDSHLYVDKERWFYVVAGCLLLWPFVILSWALDN